MSASCCESFGCPDALWCLIQEPRSHTPTTDIIEAEAFTHQLDDTFTTNLPQYRVNQNTCFIILWIVFTTIRIKISINVSYYHLGDTSTSTEFIDSLVGYILRECSCFEASFCIIQQHFFYLEDRFV